MDRYLQYLKWEEFEATKVSGFPPSRPIEETMDSVAKSAVFKTLYGLPKGAILHSHECAYNIIYNFFLEWF